MISLNIESDISQVTRLLDSLAKDIVPKAANSAINKTINTVRSKATKAIARATGIKPQRKIRESLLIRKSRPSRLIGSVHSIPANKGKGMNLIQFVTAGKRNIGAFRKTKGVTAKAWNQSKQYKGSFMGRAKNSGKLLVYARTSRKDYPIKALRGPSIPVSFMNKQTQRIIDRIGRATFKKNFDREIAYRLSRVK